MLRLFRLLILLFLTHLILFLLHCSFVFEQIHWIVPGSSLYILKIITPFLRYNGCH